MYRAKTCVECGRLFRPTSPTARYCSGGCRATGNRIYQREYFHAAKKQHPQYERRRRAAAVKHITKIGIETVREKRRENSRRYKERVRSDPERLAAARAYGREWRRAWRAIVLADPGAG